MDALHDVFEGAVKSMVVGVKCHHAGVRRESLFTTVELTTEDGDSVQTALNRHFTADEEVEWDCEHRGRVSQLSSGFIKADGGMKGELHGHREERPMHNSIPKSAYRVVETLQMGPGGQGWSVGEC